MLKAPVSSAARSRRSTRPLLGGFWLAASLAVATSLSSCASVEFTRETATSGTFVSTGVGFTFFSIDMPKSAIDIARENASDARQPNTQITEAGVWPYLGWFDWLLDIVGVRYAKVSGTWGFPPE
jgi:hypothetical protein